MVDSKGFDRTCSVGQIASTRRGATSTGGEQCERTNAGVADFCLGMAAFRLVDASDRCEPRSIIDHRRTAAKSAVERTAPPTAAPQCDGRNALNKSRKREQRGDAGAILRAIGAWLERGARKVNPKLTSKLDVPEVYKAEAHRIAGENRAQVTKAGCCEGRSVFRARSRGCAGAAGKILGITEV